MPIVPHAAAALPAVSALAIDTPEEPPGPAAVVDALREFIAQRRLAGDGGAVGLDTDAARGSGVDARDQRIGGALTEFETLATVAVTPGVDSWRAFAEEAAARQISFDDFQALLRDVMQVPSAPPLAVVTITPPLDTSLSPPPPRSSEDEGKCIKTGVIILYHANPSHNLTRSP